MPTGGSGSPFFAWDKGKRTGCGVGRLSRGDGSLFPGLRGFMRAFPKGKCPPEGGGRGGAGGYSLWSSSHSFSAVGCQQAA